MGTPPDIASALRAGEARLDRADVRVLLCHVLRCETAHLITHPEASLTPAQQGEFGALVERRLAGEPVAYLTAEREFFGHRFRVSGAVLIPRPETELVVELALERLPPDRAASVLDLGTGSGCIAISIALARPRTRVHAVDLSSDALEVARENARILGVRNVTLQQSNWFAAVGGARFDIIVANPPYVAAGDPHLGRGDLRFEPSLALEGGGDGLAAIRDIVDAAPDFLEPGGWLFLEHGYDQAERVATLMRARGFGSVVSSPDLAGIYRVTGGRLTPR